MTHCWKVKYVGTSIVPCFLVNLNFRPGFTHLGCAPLQVKYLFLVLVDLCKRTAPLPHPQPRAQQIANPILRLHFIDGQFNVAPEVVEASLGPHMQVNTLSHLSKFPSKFAHEMPKRPNLCFLVLYFSYSSPRCSHF